MVPPPAYPVGEPLYSLGLRFLPWGSAPNPAGARIGLRPALRCAGGPAVQRDRRRRTARLPREIRVVLSHFDEHAGQQTHQLHDGPVDTKHVIDVSFCLRAGCNVQPLGAKPPPPRRESAVKVRGATGTEPRAGHAVSEHGEYLRGSRLGTLVNPERAHTYPVEIFGRRCAAITGATNTTVSLPHLASRISHPASRIPHPASRITHPASRIPPPLPSPACTTSPPSAPASKPSA